MATYITSQSRTGYDRRWEDKVFPSGTKCIELVDYVGKGEVDDNGDVVGNGGPGNWYGAYYCEAVSFYRAFANATFGGPCIVEIGEYPADALNDAGEAIITDTTTRINMAAAFKNSDLQVLPHGCSRYLIDNLNGTFDGCRQLKHFTPQQLVAENLAMVKDPNAPRILRSNGMAESAFLFNLAPKTMKRMFAWCEQYDGHAINAISWSKLAKEDSASGFATGCRFDSHFLNAIIARIHWQFFVEKTVRTPLVNVDLGAGYVTGDTAKQAKELIAAGIELTGFEID